MDLPDEELKQPLVDQHPQQQQNAPSRSPLHKQQQQQINGAKPQDIMRGVPALNLPKHATNNYVAMRNPPDEEEEKEDNSSQHVRHDVKQNQLPYAAPNVHPYAVPQYQPNAYGNDSGLGASGVGGGGGWGTSHEQSYDDVHNSNIDLAVSGMYTLAAAFTIIQGFGMLIYFTYSASEFRVFAVMMAFVWTFVIY